MTAIKIEPVELVQAHSLLADAGLRGCDRWRRVVFGVAIRRAGVRRGRSWTRKYPTPCERWTSTWVWTLNNTFSPSEADRMAARALTRGHHLAGSHVQVAGVSCTATIATDRTKKGGHRCATAWRGEDGGRVYSLTLKKRGARPRWRGRGGQQALSQYAGGGLRRRRTGRYAPARRRIGPQGLALGGIRAPVVKLTWKT